MSTSEQQPPLGAAPIPPPTYEPEGDVVTHPKRSWERWSVRSEDPRKGHIVTTTHDCGWASTVDTLQNKYAIVDAQRLHDRECTSSSTGTGASALSVIRHQGQSAVTVEQMTDREDERAALKALYHQIPAYVDFESALWGASKVLLLMRGGAASQTSAEVDASPDERASHTDAQSRPSGAGSSSSQPVAPTDSLPDTKGQEP